jgi:cytochrome P450
LADPLAFIAAVTDKYGPVAGLILGGERVVLVSDAAAARQVLLGAAPGAEADSSANASPSSSPPAFVKEGTAFFPGSSLTGNGLLVSDGEVWRRQRRLSNPAFRRAAVEGYGACMVRGAERLFGGQGGAAAPPRSPSLWERAAAASDNGDESGSVRDVYADFNTLTLEVALEALFGLPPGRSEGGDENDDDEQQAAAAELGARVVSAVERAFRYFAARGASAGGLPPLPEWVPTPQNAEFAAAVRDLDSLVYGIIADRRREMAEDKAAAATGREAEPRQRRRRGDLLQSLLEASEGEESGMDDRALRDELMTLLVAGQETSAIALGWACALLASDREAQAWAAEGARAALRTGEGGPSLRAPTSADAFSGALARVEAVVLEALRLWSPAYMVGRCASRDVELCALPPPAAAAGEEGSYFGRVWAEEAGAADAPSSSSSAAAAAAASSLAFIEREARAGVYSIPKGTTVLVSPYLLHRDPRWWGGPVDATAFRPRRWLDLAGRASESESSSSPSTTGPLWPAALRDLGPNGAYVPFGAGPRVCIGTGFAMMEAVLVLAALLARYELLPAPSAEAPPFPRPAAVLTLRPEAVPLRIRRRD